MATREGMKIWPIVMLTPADTTKPAIIHVYRRSLPISDHSALVNPVGSINCLSVESNGAQRHALGRKLSENYHTGIVVSR